MDTQYLVKMSVTLRPVNNHLGPLQVKLSINDISRIERLQNQSTLNFEFYSSSECNLIVELIDKQDQEAVIVEQISFFDIKDPRFAWAGIYEPEYPEPWASQQRSQGIVLDSQLTPHVYLGWPGKWRLTFTVPVFTWIHKIQNLGWIYS